MTKADRWLILFLVFISGFFMAWKTLGLSQGPSQVKVSLEGQTVLSFPLNQEEKRYNLRLPKGEAVLEVKKGAVRLLEMEEEICPRHICSHTGWISKRGESIVCVPNRLVVQVTEAGEEIVDAVSR